MRAIIFIFLALASFTCEADLGGGASTNTTLFYAAPTLTNGTGDCNSIAPLTVNVTNGVTAYPFTFETSPCNNAVITGVTLTTSTNAALVVTSINTAYITAGQNITITGATGMTQLNNSSFSPWLIASVTGSGPYTINITTPTNTSWTTPYNASSGSFAPVYNSMYPVYNPGEFETTLNIIYSCPNSAMTNGIKFQGGWNVKMIGCNESGMTTAVGSACYQFIGASGIVYVEGIVCDNHLISNYQRGLVLNGSGAAITALAGITATFCSDGSCGMDAFHMIPSTTAGLVKGMGLSGTGIGTYTQITAINPTTGCTNSPAGPCLALGQVNAAGTVTNAGQVSSPFSSQFNGVIANETNSAVSFLNVYYPRIIAQNTRWYGMPGQPSGSFHSDGFQYEGNAWGGCFYNFTVYTNMNALEIDPQMSVTKTRVSNANLAFSGPGTPNALFFNMVDSNGSNNVAAYNVVYPIILNNVFLETNAAGVYNSNPNPFTSTTFGPLYYATASNGLNPGTQITFSSATLITGSVTGGDPPGGDFAPASLTGINYVQQPSLNQPCN